MTAISVAVVREQAREEARVALVPEVVARLIKGGASVWVQAGAGLASTFSDQQYTGAGATVVATAAEALQRANVLVKVLAPSAEELLQLPEGAITASFLRADDALVAALNQRKHTALAMERVPRTTRAQSMDALSSQATVAGYKAVLMAAGGLPRLLPMLTTAAGTLTPGRALILGAGVAGLQAIATARRLGAVVSAFDVRAAAKEQVHSLGAKFIDTDAVTASAEGQGGYAKEVGADEQERIHRSIARVINDADLVVSTAAIPNKRAPLLITAAMVATMRPGSIIVDLAAETGGNCELTKPGQTVEVSGVKVIGPLNLAASMPLHASQMYSRNVLALLGLLNKNGQLELDLADDIIAAMAVTHRGERRA